MTEPSRAVFLSYASQDAEAAQKICEALRAAAVEVWFDKSELRGGDAWDAKIRRQIRECALFLPIISEDTQRRGGAGARNRYGFELVERVDALVGKGPGRSRIQSAAPGRREVD